MVLAKNEDYKSFEHEHENSIVLFVDPIIIMKYQIIFDPDKFSNQEVQIGNQKEYIKNFDKDIQFYLWIKKAKNLQKDIFKKTSDCDVITFFKYQEMNETIEKGVECKLKFLNKNYELTDLDKKICSLLYEK